VRCPTDAQGRFLALVDEHDPVRFTSGGDVVDQRDIVTYYRGKARPATISIAIREGWIFDEGEGWYSLGEDGLLALGLWRERKLKAPPAPTPTLTGRDRDVVALAAQALQLGYVLCPAPQPAPRREANRLTREGWITRCWVANDARGMVPTPLASVEVEPETADIA
jgi:hypothetical protein